MKHELRVALVHKVFPGGAAGIEHLAATLRVCAGEGAELALLPELPLDPWIPATRKVRETDAEEPGGPRHRALAAAAREASVALLGGAITRGGPGGRRVNRALLFGPDGTLLLGYDKLHLPSEPGFWESDHYAPGDEPPRVVELCGFPLGVQICSDLNRPVGGQLLAAQGAAAVLGPRATPTESYPRWRDVIRANAIVCAAYFLSPNRPASEAGVEIGGPSLAVGPDGAILLESSGACGLVTLERAAVERARRDYPGYLDRPATLYARGFGGLAGAGSGGGS